MNVSFGSSLAALIAREALSHETLHADDRRAAALDGHVEPATTKLDTISDMNQTDMLRMQMSMRTGSAR